MADEIVEIELSDEHFEYLTKMSEETGKSINDLIIQSLREVIRIELLKQK